MAATYKACASGIAVGARLEVPCSTSAGANFCLIGVVALIVIGPKELPGVLRTIGQWTRKIRSMAAEFQGQFQEAHARSRDGRPQEGGRQSPMAPATSRSTIRSIRRSATTSRSSARETRTSISRLDTPRTGADNRADGYVALKQRRRAAGRRLPHEAADDRRQRRPRSRPHQGPSAGAAAGHHARAATAAPSRSPRADTERTRARTA